MINQEISYDLMVACKDIGEGHRHEKDSLSNYFIDPISTVGAYDVKLEGRKVQKDDLFEVPSVVCTNQRISCILGLCYWLSDCFKKNREVYSSDAFTVSFASRSLHPPKCLLIFF